MQATLGNIAYSSLKSFRAFSRGREVSIDEIKMLEGKPRVQGTGAGLDKISLTFLFHASFCNPEQELQKLNDAMQAFEVLPFVLGNGRVLGDFLIESVSDTVSKSDPLGNTVYLEAEVKLKESPPADKVASAELKAIQAGFAYAGSAAPKNPVSIPANAFASAALNRSIAINNASAANSQLDLANRAPSKSDAALAKIKSLTSAASIAALEVANKTREVQSQINDAERIIKDAEDTAKFATDMANALDISEAGAINTAYQEATARMKKSAAYFITVVATRG